MYTYYIVYSIDGNMSFRRTMVNTNEKLDSRTTIENFETEASKKMGSSYTVVLINALEVTYDETVNQIISI